MSAEQTRNWDEIRVLWIEFNYYLIEANSQITPRERKIIAGIGAVATLGLIGLAAWTVLRKTHKNPL